MATGDNRTTDSAAEPFVSILRGAAPYVHTHHGRVFVLAFGGDAALRGDFTAQLQDIALLASLGVKLVVVHGARPQIDDAMLAHQLKARFVDDLRVTTPAAMECVKAAVGALRIDIEACLSTGRNGTPMRGAQVKLAGGNWITARPVGVRAGVDHQLTGEVRRVDIAAIRAVLDEGRIALLSPLGYSPTGEVFNLRAGDVARAVASGLAADKLIFMLNTRLPREVLADHIGDAGQLALAEAARLVDSIDGPAPSAEDRTLLESALAAGRAGVSRVHLIGAEPDGALLRELYTRDGCGVMLYADADYEAVRTAAIDDIGGVLALIQPLENEGVLVPRSREQLELEIASFDVMVRDGTVIACAALGPFPENGMAEFSCVAVHPDYQRSGRATALLARAEASARSAGIDKLFALTTHAPDWFVEHGCARARIEDLPMRKRDLYNYQRKSIVLVKKLRAAR